LLVANDSELNQVWTNLIDNAIYGTEGKGRIDTRRDGNHLVVEIANNGRGIPPEVQARIFEPFFATKGGARTGLGLVISYRIVVDRHHARSPSNRDQARRALKCGYLLIAAG
jgi:signal transduction histidine kinase